MSSIPIERPQAGEFLAYYGRYIDLVPAGDIRTILADQNRRTLDLVRGLGEEKGGFRYAADKWSIKELVGHLTDAERIFSDRALRFARGDANDQPGFEENDYVKNAGFDRLSLAEVASGFEIVRRSTLSLLGTIDEKAALSRGKANGAEISVRALAYVIAGHELHHVNVLKQRYLA